MEIKRFFIRRIPTHQENSDQQLQAERITGSQSLTVDAEQVAVSGVQVVTYADTFERETDRYLREQARLAGWQDSEA